MQIACMLPVILMGRERKEDALHSMNLLPLRHGLYPCVVSPYFQKIKRLLIGRRLFLIRYSVF